MTCCMKNDGRSGIQEMMDFLGLVNRPHFTEYYLKPLLQSGRLVMTLPDKPTSKNQKYVKGKKIDKKDTW